MNSNEKESILQWLRGEFPLNLPVQSEVYHHRSSSLPLDEDPTAATRSSGSSFSDHDLVVVPSSLMVTTRQDSLSGSLRIQPVEIEMVNLAEDDMTSTSQPTTTTHSLPTSRSSRIERLPPQPVVPINRVEIDGGGLFLEEYLFQDSSPHRYSLVQRTILILLVLQNAVLFLALAFLYAQDLSPRDLPPGDPQAATHASYFHINNFPYYKLYNLHPLIFLTQAWQLVLGLFMETATGPGWSVFCRASSWIQLSKLGSMLVPSLLYIAHAALLESTLSPRDYLDSSIYHIGFQLKLLFAAWFQMLLLTHDSLGDSDRRGSGVPRTRPRYNYQLFQWVALVLIVVGVSRFGGNNPLLDMDRDSLPSMVTIFVAGVCLALSSVVLEKALQPAATQASFEPPPSIWVRIMQWSLCCMLWLLLQNAWLAWRHGLPFGYAYHDVSQFQPSPRGLPTLSSFWNSRFEHSSYLRPKMHAFSGSNASSNETLDSSNGLTVVVLLCLAFWNAVGGMLMLAAIQYTHAVAKELATSAVTSMVVILGASIFFGMKIRYRCFVGSGLIVLGWCLFRRHACVQESVRRSLIRLIRILKRGR